MSELPKDLGGYQHLAPDVVALRDDLYVAHGTPMRYVTEGEGRTVRYLEEGSGWRVYRLLPVAKQGDIDTSGWKTIREEAKTCPGMSREEIEALRRKSDELERRAFETVMAAIATPKKEDNLPLPSDAQARKNTPIASGFCDYFPLAMAEISRVSKAGNDQHNPGKPLHWDRTKSGDESDALMRHFLERGTRDTDGQLHSAKLAWRSMALLEKELEANRGA